MATEVAEQVQDLGLELLTYLTPEPRSIESIARDMGILAGRITALVKLWRQKGVRLHCGYVSKVGRCIWADRAQWGQIQELAQSYWTLAYGE